MGERTNTQAVDEDIGSRVMDLLIMLYEDQTGEKYQYTLVSTGDKTA